MRKQKKMGAPLKRDVKLLGTGITADLDSRYKTLAETAFIRKTELKRLALEWVMAGIEAGRLAVHREHHETTIVEAALPESQESELEHILDTLLHQLPKPPQPNEDGEYGSIHMSIGAPIWDTAERARKLLSMCESTEVPLPDTQEPDTITAS